MAGLIYHFSPSSYYSQKGRFCLEEKGLPYKEVFVYLPFGDVHQPWFLKMNPEGQVPVLQHGDKFIADSTKIPEYLDKYFEGPKIVPEEGSQAFNFCKQCQDIEIDVLTFGAMIFPELTQESEVFKIISFMANKATKVDFKTQYTQLAEQNPELREIYHKKIDNLSKLQGNARSKENVVKVLEKVKVVINTAEKQLSHNAGEGKADNWLYGPNFTLADIELAIMMTRLKYIGMSKSTWMDGSYLYLESYYQRMLKRNSFQKVCMYPASYVMVRYISRLLQIVAKKVSYYAMFGVVFGAVGYYAYKYVYNN